MQKPSFLNDLLTFAFKFSNTWEESDPGRHLSFRESDFNQVDTYARNVRQNGTTITPEQLATKYVVRPYRRDIQKVRAIFIWIIENIRMGPPQDGGSASKNHGSDNDNESSIGGFGTSTHAEQVEKDWVETAEVVLSKRWCRTGVGFARLFCEMAVAAGLEDIKVVYGYLRVPKDNIEVATRSNGKIKINHAWCAGESIELQRVV
jgi:transglutaminase/protease-like cytokinesis protein 3